MKRESLERAVQGLKKMCVLLIQRTSSSSRFAFPEDERTNRLFEALVLGVEDRYGTVTAQRLADIAVYIEYSNREDGRRRFIGVLTQIPRKYDISVLGFYQRRKYAMTRFENEWLSRFRLTRQMVVEQFEDRPRAAAVPTPFEDNARRRFLNTNTGYVFCHQQTSGWDPSSTVCGRCEFAERCKGDLEQSFPALYRQRNELSG